LHKRANSRGQTTPGWLPRQVSPPGPLLCKETSPKLSFSAFTSDSWLTTVSSLVCNFNVDIGTLRFVLL
jgi:hypothetical protein